MNKWSSFVTMELKLALLWKLETTAIDIEEGMYELLFTAKRLENGLGHYSLDFIKSNNPKANIIKVDEELNPPSVLLMEAEPAI